MNDCLSVLTLNVGLLRFGCGGLTVSEPVPFVTERAAALPETLSGIDADIIALQEIYHPDHQWAVIDRLKMSHPFAVGLDERKKLAIGPGLLILSRFPIKRHGFVQFKQQPIEERLLVRKGCRYLVIEVPEMGEMFIGNVHTSAGGLRHPESPSIERIRSSQLKQVIALTATAQDLPQILVGDFNAGPEASNCNYRQLQAADFVDACVICPDFTPPGQATWNPVNALNVGGFHSRVHACPPQRVDHVFCNRRFVKRWVARSAETVFREPMVVAGGHRYELSDHYGVRVAWIPA